MAISGITLWLLGGVSKLEGEPSSAAAEFRIAAVGPLTSLGLAGLFFVLAAGAAGLALPDLVVGTLAWLSLINLVLALFNMLPAYPLDGGRVLRALVWERNADRLAATRVVARVSHYLAWGLIGLGLVSALGGLVISGLWLVLIGWFLDNAGRAEASMAAEQGALGAVRADQLMASPPVTVSQGLTVDALVHDYVLSRRHSAFPVIDAAGAPTGLVALEDVRRLPPEQRAVVTVGEIAVPLAALPVVHPDDLGLTVLERMRATGSRRALVVDDQGGLVGIISNADIVRALDVGTLAPPPPSPSSPPAPPPAPPPAQGPPDGVPPGWTRPGDPSAPASASPHDLAP